MKENLEKTEINQGIETFGSSDGGNIVRTTSFTISKRTIFNQDGTIREEIR
ncbi:MAG: hypothetical protein FWE24_09245 [Defluviitaleaceae bacterium]|nr:hypothetical protein [Defluviitaleaceae bacterium]